MMIYIAQKLTQFGSGFAPVVDTAWTDGSDTEAGVLTNLEAFISQILGLITVIGSLFFVINFLMAALSWITAAGDSGKIQKARDQMIQSTLGLVIMVGSYAIIGLIGSVVGIDILQPGQALKMLIPR
jgi:hypothetical protein